MRLGADIAFAVHANADGVRFHVALSDYEHGMNFHLLGVLDLRGIGGLICFSELTVFWYIITLWRMVSLS